MDKSGTRQRFETWLQGALTDAQVGFENERDALLLMACEMSDAIRRDGALSPLSVCEAARHLCRGLDWHLGLLRHEAARLEALGQVRNAWERFNRPAKRCGREVCDVDIG
ncbi:MAG: hypothetical protein II943_00525 [Victivallales bacterium]|nr:hypothetical protein [Victivallales bacterium]